MRISVLKAMPAVLMMGMVIDASAADGVLEINQACALNGGCFPGDSSGFPVTITQMGSYRLTGNLTLSADVDAILITTSSVTLDLGGFVISGPGTCTGSGPTIDCGAEGAGSGIWVDNNPDSVTIRNGVISNMRLTGIRAEGNGHLFEALKLRRNHSFGLVADERMIVRNCTAVQNGGAGFKLNDGSIVEGSVAMGNGTHGIHLVNEGSTAYGNTSQGNGEFGFLLDTESRYGSDNASHGNDSGDSCGGGICTAKTRYYLSQSKHNGNEALNACAAGFHMASLWELFDTSKLAYDTRLGASKDDAGQGPPSGFGWIRTGESASSFEIAGTANCRSWESADFNDSGTAITLLADWNNETTSYSSPWHASLGRCSSRVGVWCVEDH